jgi:hypothetical protein
MGATTASAPPIGPLRPCDLLSCERGAPLAVLDSFEFGQAQDPARAMRPDVAHRPEARLTAVRSTDGAPRDLGLFVGPLAQNCCGIVSHRWTTLVVVRPSPARSDPRGGTSSSPYVAPWTPSTVAHLAQLKRSGTSVHGQPGKC